MVRLFEWLAHLKNTKASVIEYSENKLNKELFKNNYALE
jgi:hypothetical protein